MVLVFVNNSVVNKDCKVMMWSSLIFFLCCSNLGFSELYNDIYKWPTIGISILVRNKAHTLPYFLSCLQKIDYPKERIFIWIYSDYNEDNSIEVIENWAQHYSSAYNGVYITTNNTSGPNYGDEKSVSDWSLMRFKHVIQLREMALHFSKNKWADFIFMLDADIFLTNPFTLKNLVKKSFTVVSPMLVTDGVYSNFWCGMTEEYYYKSTEDYKPILNREKIGCFPVPMVHSAVLISLREVASDFLTYNPDKILNYDGPLDDIIAFAYSAKQNDIPLYICNDDFYGYMPVPLSDEDKLEKDMDQLLNIKLEAISNGTPLTLEENLEKFVIYPEPWKFGCEEIYMINLERRSERRQLMELSFKELGMDAKLFKAVDGRNLDVNDLSDFAITLLPGYEDPYHKRPMKAGEIGCFLSHYYIWEEIVEKNLETALVLEDDLHFVPYFRDKFYRLMREIYELNWDFVYIGRKILQHGEEQYVTEHTTRPLYSYWTLGYLLSQRGARKLLAAEPLTKLLPVDEFLPIMFDEHPNTTWKSYFLKRNLIALSAAPLLVYPTHYTGEEGYISDTEDSNVVSLDVDNSNDNVKNEL